MNTKLINTKLQKRNWQAVLKHLESGKFSWYVDMGTDEQGRRINVSSKTTDGELAEELMLNSITILGGKDGADLHGEMVRIKGELDEMARVSGNPGGKENLMSTKSRKRKWQAVLKRLKSGKFSWYVDMGTDEQGRRIKVSSKTTDGELAEELMLNSITILGGKDGADLHGEMVRIKGELDEMARVSDNPGGPA